MAHKAFKCYNELVPFMAQRVLCMDRNAEDYTKIWSDLKDYTFSRAIEGFLSFEECEVAGKFDLQAASVQRGLKAQEKELKECFNKYKKLTTEMSSLHKIKNSKEIRNGEHKRTMLEPVDNLKKMVSEGCLSFNLE